MNFLRLFLLIICFNAFSQTNVSKSNAKIADSLDTEGNYEEALKYRNLTLKETRYSKDYKTYLKARWHYTKSCALETVGGKKNILEGLEHSKKALRIIESIPSTINKHTFTKYLIVSRMYMQFGYTGQWQKTLKYAKKTYNILRDTFPDHKIEVLHTLDNLGFIYTKLENPEKSNEYYEYSFKLYKKHHPENLKDVYINNYRIINNYRKLGLKNEEFKLLNDSENYWVNKYKEEDAFFQQFKIYERLADWHINYGNKNVAESYLFKKEELFDSVSNSRKKAEKIALTKRERVNLNESYIKLYLKHKEYDKAKHFINKTKEILKDSLKKYRWSVVRRVNLYVEESKLPNISYSNAEKLLKASLSLIKKSKDLYYINPLQYQEALFDFYATHKKKEKALELLKEILKNKELTKHSKAKLLFKKALLSQNEDTEIHIKTAFTQLLKSPNEPLNLKTLEIQQLHELYTFDILTSILNAANFYLNRYKTSNTKEHLDIAHNLFILSSNFFGRIYKGDAFNDNLYKSFKIIEEGLINCALLNPTEKIYNEIIEAIENNNSKLTWSKFTYGKSSKINVPDSLILKEERLLSLINYYQERVYETKQSQIISIDSLKHRLTDLNNQLTTHQKYITKNFNKYNKLSSNSFNIYMFKDQLKDNQIAIKYIISKKNLFVFTITKENINLQQIIKNKDIESEIKNFVKNVSTFNSTLTITDILRELIEPINNTNKQDITIVHSGLLNLLPFEVLLPNYFDSDKVLHYTSSLKMYHEQVNTDLINKKLNVGIYKAQNNGSLNNINFLPDLEREITGIKKYTEATDYYIKNRNELLKNVLPHNILHFGIHTTIDEEMPELSALNFAESKVLIGSLYNTPLQADLAVLSACDTGNGRYINGEGIQSVSKAFTYAGVPSTVISLWKVDDKATATLMSSFYKHLNNGKSKSLALKLAKKDYLNSDIDEELKHPYYWSGFIISGNITPFSKDLSMWWLMFLLFPLLLFLYKKFKV